VGLKTNKFGDLTCVKYRSVERPKFDGVRALPEQLQVKPPRVRDTSMSSESSGQKCKRTSVADLEETIDVILETNEILTKAEIRNKHSIDT